MIRMCWSCWKVREVDAVGKCSACAAAKRARVWVEQERITEDERIGQREDEDERRRDVEEMHEHKGTT